MKQNKSRTFPQGINPTERTNRICPFIPAARPQGIQGKVRGKSLLLLSGLIVFAGVFSFGIIHAQSADKGSASVVIDGGIEVVTIVVKDPDGVCTFFVRSGAGQGLASAGSGGGRLCNLATRSVGPFRVTGYTQPFFPLKVEVTDKNNNKYTLTVEDGERGEDIKYPVAELGNCKDKEDCKKYCGAPENIKACISFAEKHNLISKEGAAKSKSLSGVINGPGSCQSQNECESYCNDISHIDECLEFGSRAGLIPPEELEEARKVAKALKEGVQTPGNCRNKTACEAYCNDPSHLEECFAFAESAGFIPPEEREGAKKVMAAMASGAKTPGNCKGKAQCETYCSDSSHMDECFAFAEKAGLIPQEELEQARKIIPLMKRGEMPGGCRSKETCETYCQDETHNQECMEFAVKAGFMKPEELELFKKTGGKGPGGCKGKEECEAFCNNQANQEACFKFGEEHGLIPPEQLQQIKEGSQRIRRELSNFPPEVSECLKSKLGPNVLEKIQSGELTPGPEIGDSMRSCFEALAPQIGPPGEHQEQEGQIRDRGLPEGPGKFRDQAPSPGYPKSQEGFGGPGGCKTPEECAKYCSNPANQAECSGFEKPRTDTQEIQRTEPESFKEPTPGAVSPEATPPPEFQRSTPPPQSKVNNFLGVIIKFLQGK